jgi:hypothetical protein
MASRMFASRSFALRTLLARGVLALLLVFAQQQATLHWLSHAVDSVAQKAKHGSSDVCGECAALVAFDAMAAPAPLSLAVPHGTDTVAELAEPASIARAPQLAFRSRAPPILS